MWTFIFYLLFFVPEMIEDARDPIMRGLPDGAERRDLECELLTTESATAKAPGRIPQPRGRSDFFERRAMICREKLFHDGERRAQDEAILQTLHRSAEEIASLVREVDDDAPLRTWLVETHYPDPSVAHKIAFAVKNALRDRELRVSDRAPLLAAGDIEVIAGQPPKVAYPLACQRFHSYGSLEAADGLVSVVLRDPRETILHVGVCTNGHWRWLQ